MYFIPLTPIGSTCLEWVATDESLTEYPLQDDSLLHQPVEQQAARAGYTAVETKVNSPDMVWPYRTLVHTEQPSF
jgi:hypothetical protein